MKIDELINYYKKIMDLFGEESPIRGDKYTMGQILDALEFLKSLAKFSVGDRVELVKDYKPEKSSGWYHCRKHLIAGSKATIKDVHCYEKQFSYYIMFDYETSTSNNEICIPDRYNGPDDEERKYVFWFPEEC